MEIKHLLLTLLAHADEIQSQDADLLKDVFEAYQFEPVEVGEPEQDPEHEVQETPETETLEQETGVELGEPLGEVAPEEVVEELPTEVAPTDVVEGEVPPQEAIAPEMVEELPVEEVAPDPLENITAQLTDLKGEIEALKSLLEKVAVRTPVSEEEADEEEENVGAKGKQGMPNLKEPDVQDTLIKKLGGYAR